MKAGVLTTLNTVISLAVVSIMWCLLSKQKMWFVSQRVERSFEAWCSGNLWFSLPKWAAPWVATLLPNCVITAGVSDCSEGKKKKKLILEVDVDFPVFYEKEKAYRLLIHLD